MNLTQDQALALEFIGQAINATDRNFGLSDVANDAARALQAAIKILNPVAADFLLVSNKQLEELRLARMAIERETKMITQSIRDAAAFLNTEEAKAGIESMRKYVEVCERIQTLRNDGTFDTVLNAFLSMMEADAKTV